LENFYDQEKDLDFFIENQDKLVDKYDGWILLIRNRKADTWIRNGIIWIEKSWEN
jgi:hypothetical protein